MSRTPWRVDLVAQSDRAVIRDANDDTLAVAIDAGEVEVWQHAVRCVNSHDALRDAIKALAASFRDVVSDFSGDDPDEWESLNAADAAIALAEGDAK